VAIVELELRNPRVGPKAKESLIDGNRAATVADEMDVDGVVRLRRQS
jgi:hypothetical protein